VLRLVLRGAPGDGQSAAPYRDRRRGYIAAEFSCIAAIAGANVVVFQRGDPMLSPFDPDIVGWLMPAFEEHGIDVRTKTNVEKIIADLKQSKENWRARKDKLRTLF